MRRREIEDLLNQEISLLELKVLDAFRTAGINVMVESRHGVVSKKSTWIATPAVSDPHGVSNTKKTLTFQVKGSENIDPDYAQAFVARGIKLADADDERVRELVRREVRLQLLDQLKECESGATVSVRVECGNSEVVLASFPVEVPLLRERAVGLLDSLSDFDEALDADHASSPVGNGPPNVPEGRG